MPVLWSAGQCERLSPWPGVRLYALSLLLRLPQVRPTLCVSRGADEGLCGGRETMEEGVMSNQTTEQLAAAWDSPDCPRCGGGLEWANCSEGCDEGWFEPYEWNPTEYLPDERTPCHLCWGKGGWWFCWNSEAFCTSEGAKRGTAEKPRVLFDG